MELSVTVGPVTVLSVKGSVDAGTFRELMEKGEQLISQGYRNLILDLHEVNYISSAGLIALQTIAAKASDKGGKAVIAGLNKPVQHVIELAGFDTILSIYSDLPAALASLEKS